MKTLLRFFSICFFVCCSTDYSIAQTVKKDSLLLPYLTYRSLPAFQIRMLDSHTIYNTYKIQKGKPTVFIMFSPDCDHCELLSKMIVDNIDSFDKVKLIMVSPMPLKQIKQFAIDNRLTQHKKITVGQDVDYFFGSFFKADTVPFIVIYDKDKQFVNVIKRLKKNEALLEIIRNLNP